jgi:uncharacterized protein (TIGR00251 family)
MRSSPPQPRRCAGRGPDELAQRRCLSLDCAHDATRLRRMRRGLGVRGGHRLRSPPGTPCAGAARRTARPRHLDFSVTPKAFATNDVVWRVSRAQSSFDTVAETRIAVRLQARARRDELVGIRDGVLLARVSAPPIDGRANDVLCRLIARRAGVAPSRVTIVRGQRSRDKLVRIEGLDASALCEFLRRP